MQIVVDGITKAVILHFEKFFKSSKKTYREMGTQTNRYGPYRMVEFLTNSFRKYEAPFFAKTFPLRPLLLRFWRKQVLRIIIWRKLCQ